MTKADLVEEIATQTGISRNQTAVIVDQLLDAMSRALSEGRHLEIRGFGTFKVKERKERMARNPRTGDAVPVPGRRVPIFRPNPQPLFSQEPTRRQLGLNWH